MNTYFVRVPICGYISYTVEADSAEQAREAGIACCDLGVLFPMRRVIIAGEGGSVVCDSIEVEGADL